ncbi:MAG: class I SAM-dependent methyltransferase [Deltaproteobacteria bacterium]|nr:class I SAM-dependent methyltransferase [Deltaproteobacteria bacterium]
MEQGRASTTAQLVAGLRAAHYQSGEHPLVFEDPFAAHFTGGVFQAPLERGELQAYLDRMQLQPIQGGIVARARYAEDALERAIVEAGVRQLVLLGAGNDSFLLRRPDLLARIRVFELDHPDSQAEKRAKLRALGFADHPSACFVPVDFEQEPAGIALARHGFDPAVPAFFNWLGVVAYLTHEAISATLGSLRAVSAVGSRIVFDYPIAPQLLEREEDRLRSVEVSRSTAAVGEPRQARHVPEVLAKSVFALGYAVVEDLSPEALFARYFSGRGDGLRPNPENRLIQLCMI